MPHIDDAPLGMVEAPAELEVSRVNSHDPDILKYLTTLKLTPGQAITLVSCAPFHGPLRLRIDGYEQVIGYELAQKIRVSRR